MIPFELSAGQWALFLVAGVISGGVNAVAGGGSLVSFPILVAAGVPSVVASATNTAAQWPGGIAGAWGLRERLPSAKDNLRLLFLPTLFGALLGAWALTLTDAKLFDQLVPGLILVATVILALKPQLSAWCRNLPRAALWAVLVQFLVAVYGGYFGAGMGILMLAVLGLIHPGDLHDANALKNVLGLLINFSAAVLLVVQGLVRWEPALALAIGSVLGGYGAARGSLRINPETLRWVIVGYGVLMGGWFAYQALWAPR
ncbi:MAG: sulfite exporter TauE/SafE family protein [Armatimonadota bacterium]|jgi:uncharacterized membrane protein YfcA|nr:sulfite exporter TauE/SafE family protein [Fimbriimonadaceae bacterium]MCZ8140017.1 sulfite exporter TauE/SafE family protein [Fimbriimonadaceae bacterium]HRD31931.1 sulfite exporter TauE/SafE family protein [Fimbriimonadaceae bacterium]HRE94949.1 sulfite exporter TauE/SafE family protein [Fimbriimonadaceae bacterium]